MVSSTKWDLTFVLKVTGIVQIHLNKCLEVIVWRCKMWVVHGKHQSFMGGPCKTLKSLILFCLKWCKNLLKKTWHWVSVYTVSMDTYGSYSHYFDVPGKNVCVKCSHAHELASTRGFMLCYQQMLEIFGPSQQNLCTLADKRETSLMSSARGFIPCRNLVFDHIKISRNISLQQVFHSAPLTQTDRQQETWRKLVVRVSEKTFPFPRSWKNLCWHRKCLLDAEDSAHSPLRKFSFSRQLLFLLSSASPWGGENSPSCASSRCFFFQETPSSQNVQDLARIAWFAVVHRQKTPGLDSRSGAPEWEPLNRRWRKKRRRVGNTTPLPDWLMTSLCVFFFSPIFVCKVSHEILILKHNLRTVFVIHKMWSPRRDWMSES